MTNTSAIPPVVATVDFHDQKILTIRKDGIEFVAMRPVVEAIGLDWKRQREKIMSNKDKFNWGLMPSVGQDGKNRDMLCIPLTKLNGFLFTINPERIPDPQVRRRVELYQEECFIVLHNYWHKGISVNPRKEADIIEETADKYNTVMLVETKELIELLRFKCNALEKEKEDARKRVTEEERELIVKLYVQRYSTPEISRMTGRKQATVRTVIRRHLEGGAI